jgi:kelch-like protein 10
VAVLDNQLYAIGGEREALRDLETVERYDCNKKQWSLIASMNMNRSNASAAALEGNINPVKQYRVN